MKKLIATAADVMLFLAVHAGNGTTTFQGVKVDGTRAYVTGSLVKKGFKQVGKDQLTNVIDDRMCTVTVYTDNGKVYKLSVVEHDGTEDPEAAINRYNDLVDQFGKDENYTEVEHNGRIYTSGRDCAGIVEEGLCYAEFFQKCEPQTLDGRVTLSISNQNGKYHIIRHYDNMRNMPGNVTFLTEQK